LKINRGKILNELHLTCKKYGIENYTINNDGSIDVDGDVRLWNRGLTKLPLNFNHVSGDFYCNWNKLTTLEFSPKSVGGGFYCGDNPIYNQLGDIDYKSYIKQLNRDKILNELLNR